MQKQYLVFLVKREESRDFDVFFWSFFGPFLVFGRERKKRREELGREQILEKCVSLSLIGAWAYCRAVGGHSRAASVKPPLIRLIFIFSF